MEFITRTFQTPNGQVEGVFVKWPDFSILMITGTKANGNARSLGVTEGAVAEDVFALIA